MIWGETSQCASELLTGKCSEWRKAQKCYFHTDPLRQKGCLICNGWSPPWSPAADFFFFLTKDGKTVNGIEIRIQTLIVRGKKIKRFFMKELSYSSFHLGSLPNSLHREAIKPQVRAAQAGEQNKDTVRLQWILVHNAFIPRCPSASGIYLSACNF